MNFFREAEHVLAIFRSALVFAEAVLKHEEKPVMLATVATMIYTDGSRVLYGVFRAPISWRRPGDPYSWEVDLNHPKAINVATVELTQRPLDRNMSDVVTLNDLVPLMRAYETPDAPAVIASPDDRQLVRTFQWKECARCTEGRA